MLIFFQCVFVIFALFAIIRVVQKKKDGTFGPLGMMFWILFWLAVAVAAVWPNGTQVIADMIGIGRGVDLVIYSALVALFYLLFKLHIKIEVISRDLTKIVRQQALSELPLPSPMKTNSDQEALAK